MPDILKRSLNVSAPYMTYLAFFPFKISDVPLFMTNYPLYFSFPFLLDVVTL